jgi:hypothetical protein
MRDSIGWVLGIMFALVCLPYAIEQGRDFARWLRRDRTI